MQWMGRIGRMRRGSSVNEASRVGAALQAIVMGLDAQEEDPSTHMKGVQESGNQADHRICSRIH